MVAKRQYPCPGSGLRTSPTGSSAFPEVKCPHCHHWASPVRKYGDYQIRSHRAVVNDPHAEGNEQEGNAVGAEGTQYVVVENTPGYMPDDDDPFVTDDYAEAVRYLYGRAAEYADDGYRVEYGYASSGNYAAVMVWDDSKSHDLGRYIGIELDES